MLLQELMAITTIVGFSNVPSLASNTEIVIRTACIHPTLGEGVCELGFPDIDDTDTWDITWQDETTTRIRLSDRSFVIELWNPQNDQWNDSSNVGFCFDRKCIHASSDQWNSLEQESSGDAIECLDPVMGESTCQVEYVPETDGFRVYWPDDSIEHYRFEGDVPSEWSYVENDWVEVAEWGICFDRFCLLFDSDMFNQFSLIDFELYENLNPA